MKFLRILLFPFAILYDIITRLRNFLFNINFLKSTSFSFPVIVVGNLSVGGTGKTPQIEYLIRLLKDSFDTAVLSRGYKRKSKGFLLLNENHTVDDSGDEPMQYFKKFANISVAVDANRVEGIQKLKDLKNPDVVLLDDAFQHRKVKGSLNILLTKYDELFINDYLLPTGNLRESRVEANRADVIIVTKCPENLDETTQKRLSKKLNKFTKNIFFSKIAYADNLVGEQSITLSDLKDYEVLLVTGIANPKPLISFLNSKGILFKHMGFPDHHHFTNQDISNISKTFKSLKSARKLLLTTEKDSTRLQTEMRDIYYLPIKTQFLDSNQAKKFNNLIIRHVKEF